jgi:mannitol-1-phosphate/altronate dehydrogenase
MNLARNNEPSQAIPLSQETLPYVGRLAGVSCPTYNRTALKIGWGHIGCGAFHRAHQAVALDHLLSNDFGRSKEWGLLGVNIVPGSTQLCDTLARQDGLYSVLQRDVAGESLRVIGSITSVICAARDLDAALSYLRSPELRLITLTVTEAGYYYDSSARRLLSDHPDIISDLSGATQYRTVLGLLARVLDERRRREIPAPTLLSCDNVCGNGGVLRSALIDFCLLKDPSLAAYVERYVSCPSSMVDRITPRITNEDCEHIQATYKLNDGAPVVCESFFQWVIEDNFPLGRPALEEVPGVIFTSDVQPYEQMKLRLLNAGHSQLGYLGYLAGYSFIHEVAGDKLFRLLLSNFWRREVVPNLEHVDGISFAGYCDTLIERFINPNLKDTTLRICLDGSAKIPSFVLPSVRAGLANRTPIDLGALCVAAWIRFCSGVDEAGREFAIEDPIADRLKTLGQEVAGSVNHDVIPFISGLPHVFGDLSNQPWFCHAVSVWVKRLYENGACATLNKYITE